MNGIGWIIFISLLLLIFRGDGFILKFPGVSLETKERKKKLSVLQLIILYLLKK
ncbi:MAG: hypothetical protein PF487_07515 [Bacteroidales bacterium]|nr:hypothetical protein [Bacteroidales bacterium]